MSSQNPIFIPGPTNIPDRFRHAIHAQTLDHRAPDFVKKFAPALEDLKKVFKTTTGAAVTFLATGTAGWEAGITNTLPAGDSVLVARYGMFSHRWIDLCQRHGLDVQIIECPWGSGALAENFEEILSNDKAHKIKAVLVTHNETTTGVKSNIAAVREGDGRSKLPDHIAVWSYSSPGLFLPIPKIRPNPGRVRYL